MPFPIYAIFLLLRIFYDAAVSPDSRSWWIVNFCIACYLGWAIGDCILFFFMTIAQSWDYLANGHFLSFCTFGLHFFLQLLYNILVLRLAFILHRIYLFPDFRAHLSEKWYFLKSSSFFIPEIKSIIATLLKKIQKK